LRGGWGPKTAPDNRRRIKLGERIPVNNQEEGYHTENLLGNEKGLMNKSGYFTEEEVERGTIPSASGQKVGEKSNTPCCPNSGDMRGRKHTD